MTNNESVMNKWAFRILVHLVSVLIVMPFGWCCWLPTAAAEQPKAPMENCCCSHAKPAKSPAPAKPAEEKPETPSCCCELAPVAVLTDVPDGTDLKPVVVLAVLPTSIDEISLDACVGWLTAPFLHLNSPPLHLLHCVWLC